MRDRLSPRKTRARASASLTLRPAAPALAKMKLSCLGSLIAAMTAGAGLAVAAGTPSIIQLRSGATISGDVLDQRTDRVVVDLGYTVLTIPAAEVEKVTPQETASEAGGTARPSISGDLFRSNGGGRARSVSENTALLGAAVVQIRTSTGLGSGFIINSEGYVVTNEHVIAGEYEITLTVFEGHDAALEKVQFNNIRIVALDPRLDLALLKIEDLGTRKLATLPIGASDELEGGMSVFAIGSPLGLERTVSQGIISLKNRVLDGAMYIQTTTQINPGNSGGPLLNLRGEVIGVNNMKAMMVGVEGVNFAIPSATLKEFLRNRDAFAFDPRNANAGFRYLSPPKPVRTP
jgi:serine protease Do